MPQSDESVPTATNYVMNEDPNMEKPSSSPLRQRPLGRASTSAEMSHPLRHRRSSNFSESIDDAKQSIKSSTDDLLLPRLREMGFPGQLEPSHWHSTPLALALLPALGGIFFQNGSAIVTDITLLGLAAIFLNWSVRLPWYVTYPHQSMLRGKSNQFLGNGTILLKLYASRTLYHPGGNGLRIQSSKRKRRETKRIKQLVIQIQSPIALEGNTATFPKLKSNHVLQLSFAHMNSLLSLHAFYLLCAVDGFFTQFVLSFQGHLRGLYRTTTSQCFFSLLRFGLCRILSS